VVDLEQEVGVGRRVGGPVDDRGRRDQPGRRDLCDGGGVPAGDPVDRGVEVRAGVLAGRDVVPVPGRPALVVPADLGQRERPRLPELVGQREDRRLRGQRRGEVDDLDGAAAERRDEVLQDGHADRR
jgi:hypothetical protein